MDSARKRDVIPRRMYSQLVNCKPKSMIQSPGDGGCYVLGMKPRTEEIQAQPSQNGAPFFPERLLECQHKEGKGSNINEHDAMYVDSRCQRMNLE